MCKLEKIGVCQIGCGNISWAHLNACKEIPELEIVTVVDTVEEKAKRAAENFGVRTWYTDYEEALKRDDVDMVNVALPHFLHAKVAVDAAEAGKHVFVEKPMANTLEECNEMIEAAKRSSVRLMVNQTKRFMPIHQKVKMFLEKGLVGEIFLAESSYPQHNHDYIIAQGSPWLLSKEEAGGGALVSLGIHNADLLRWLVGEVRKVSALTCKSKLWRDLGQKIKFPTDETGVEDTGIVLLEFDNGGIGQITTSMSLKEPFNRVNLGIMPLRLYGDIGSIHIDYDMHLHLYSDKLPKDFWGLVDVPTLPRFNETTQYMDPMAGAFKDFAECILKDKEPLVSGEEGKKTLEIIIAAYKSAEEGKTVSLPLHGQREKKGLIGRHYSQARKRFYSRST